MVRITHVNTVLNKHKKRDSWFLDDYSVNPYMGCAFNCIYCYVRGSKYGENMRERFVVKSNAPAVLERQLKKRAEKKEYGVIALATATEPYQEVEKELKLTRKLLSVILRYRFPLHILTKSALVLRDLDLFREIDAKAILPYDLRDKLKRGVIINFSISTLDERLSRIIEPGAPKPEDRLKAMQRCREEGFMSGVSYIPVLPYLSDSEEELDNMIKTAKDYGADFVFVGALTLFGSKPADCKVIYYRFLERYYPHLIQKYRRLFGYSFQPHMGYQTKLLQTAKRLCSKYKIKTESCSLFCFYG